MNRPKSNLKWLLIVLGAVIIGAGLYYYFGIFKGSKNLVTASPSPTLSATIPPSPGNTKTPSNNQSSTTTSVSTKTYDNYIADSAPSFRDDKYCNYKISFNYPSAYPTPSFISGILTVSKDSASAVKIESTGNHESDCVPGAITSPSEYYDMWHYGEILEGPTYFNVNGNSIVVWTQKSNVGTPSHPDLAKGYLKKAFVMNNTRYVLISTGYVVYPSGYAEQTTKFDSAFDTVLNSFKIQ